MMEFKMFEKLQQLPLLQGLSINELSYLLERIKLDFNRHDYGSLLAVQGDSIKKLTYVLEGQTVVRNKDKDERFMLEEYVNGIHIIEPYNLFGMWQRYDFSYSLEPGGSTLDIDKRIFCDIMMELNVVRMNLLNMMSHKLQNNSIYLRQNEPTDITGKFVRFVKNNCLKSTGKKILYSKMDDISVILSESRLNLSKALNNLADNGMVELRRKEIVIPDIAKL